MIKARIADDLGNISSRPKHWAEPRIKDGFAEIGDEIGVGINGDIDSISRQAFEDMRAEGANAGALFNEQPGVRPINGFQHMRDERIRRGND